LRRERGYGGAGMPAREVGLPNSNTLFTGFPGVEGSLYFVGGFGVNYVQRNGVALAPVRWEKRYNPL